jgi:hypothetical protein
VATSAAPAGKLPLKTAQNVKQTEEARAELLASLQEVLGLAVEVTLDIDWAELAAAADARGYNNRVGECVNTYLTSLRDNLKKHAQVEMVRDNLAAAWTTGVIKHELNDKKQTYCGAVIEDGDLIMQVSVRLSLIAVS